jgi:transcriptional regulator with XRE-family HTH domain
MISKQIGEKLKARREELNLSPKTMAAELGKSPRALLDIEAGLVDIKVSDIAIFKDFLQISVAEMFNEEITNSFTIANNTTQTGNVGVNYTGKDLLDKISELYERIIELERR